MGRRSQEEVRRLEAVIRLIEHIKYEIGERMTPHNELFVRFESNVLERCGFLDALRKCRFDGEGSALSGALRIYGDLFFEDKGCNMMLEDFSESLGMLSRTAQLERCDGLIERFNSVYKEKSAKIQSETRLCRSMGILCGVAAVLTVL